MYRDKRFVWQAKWGPKHSFKCLVFLSQNVAYHAEEEIAERIHGLCRRGEHLSNVGWLGGWEGGRKEEGDGGVREGGVTLSSNAFFPRNYK